MIVMVMPGLNYNTYTKEGFHFFDTARLVYESRTRDEFVNVGFDLIKGFDDIGQDVVMNASIQLSARLQERGVKHVLVFCAMNARENFIEQMSAVMSPIMYGVMSNAFKDAKQWVNAVQKHAVWTPGVPKVCISSKLILPTKAELEAVIDGSR